MQKRIRGLMPEFVKRGWPILNIGVGLNCGDMSVGDMGSKFRYTVMGDAVNLGSRPEASQGVRRRHPRAPGIVKAAQGFVYHARSTRWR
jgi:adenylate cyclase